MPKRKMNSSATVYTFPYIFGGDAETDIYSISYNDLNSKLLIKHDSTIGKYYVCGILNSGSFNNLTNSSAFIAQLDSEFTVEDAKLFKSTVHSTENTYAVTCDYNKDSNENYTYGIISTDKNSILFSTEYSTTTSFNGFTFYYNAIEGMSLISFQLLARVDNFFSYYYTTAANGDRQIKAIAKPAGTNDSNILTIYKDGYDTFHSVRQVSYDKFMWSAYIYQNRTDPSKSF